MNHRKLKSFVLPTLYVVILMLIFGAVSLASTLLKLNPNYLYSIGILKSISTPVVAPGGNTSMIIKPFTSEKAKVNKGFYDTEGSEEEQTKALIFFQNTYMKNTGVLYSAEEAFDVVAVLDGKVLNIKQDELLGNVVEIEHNSNLRTIYYSLDTIDIKVGDTIKQGQTLGISGTNKINPDSKYNLLFEVYYNGTLINPETFYKMDVTSLN